VLHYASSVTVDRPPDVVNQFLVDPERQKLWSDVPMRRLDGDDGPMSAGSRFEVSFGMGPLKAKVGLEISGLEPGRRMAFKSFSGPIKWEGEYRLAPTPSDSTQLSQEGTLTFTGLWRLMEPLAGGEISRGEVKELEKLKAVAEGS
jgi:Polyketide cyclase / dehydrase and lipid transport